MFVRWVVCLLVAACAANPSPNVLTKLEGSKQPILIEASVDVVDNLDEIVDTDDVPSVVEPLPVTVDLPLENLYLPWTIYPSLVCQLNLS